MPDQAAKGPSGISFAGPLHLVAPDQSKAPTKREPPVCAVPHDHASRTPPRSALPQRHPTRAESAPARSYVTARGAMVAMLGFFLVSDLIASWLHLAVMIGLGYAGACVLAPFFVRRHALLQVIVAPAAIFLVAVIISQVLTAQGTSRHGKALSVLEGTFLTLAAIAPWLFAGTALGIGAAMTQGLPQSIRDLAAGLRGQTSGADALAPLAHPAPARKS